MIGDNMAKENFGCKTTSKTSAKWGEKGVVGGGTKYNEIQLNTKFKTTGDLNIQKRNVKTDKPYDTHISSS